jgi:hypothetical protein
VRLTHAANVALGTESVRARRLPSTAALLVVTARRIRVVERRRVVEPQPSVQPVARSSGGTSTPETSASVAASAPVHSAARAPTDAGPAPLPAPTAGGTTSPAPLPSP